MPVGMNLVIAALPPKPKEITTGAVEFQPPKTENKIIFETGNLSKEEIDAIFNSLPIDISFVDKEDAVQYFNQTRDRIFPRTKAVIGRKVVIKYERYLSPII